MDDGSNGRSPKIRIPTWLGLLLMAVAVIVAGAIGLLIERLTGPR